MRCLSIVLVLAPFELHRDSVALGLGQAMSSVLPPTESVGTQLGGSCGDSPFQAPTFPP